MERPETPAPQYWNEELQDSLEDAIILSKNDISMDMEELERNTLAFFNELKEKHGLIL